MPVPPRPVSGQSTARSTWALKVADHTGSLKQMRLNLRISYIRQNHPAQPFTGQPLGTAYRQTGMTRR